MYDITHKKPETPKFVFIAIYKTCRIFWGFEQLFSTTNWRVMELQNGVKITANVGAQGTNISYSGSEGVQSDGPHKNITKSFWLYGNQSCSNSIFSTQDPLFLCIKLHWVVTWLSPPQGMFLMHALQSNWIHFSQVVQVWN